MAQKKARSKTNVAVEMDLETVKKLRGAGQVLAHAANAFVLATNEATHLLQRG